MNIDNESNNKHEVLEKYEYEMFKLWTMAVGANEVPMLLGAAVSCVANILANEDEGALHRSLEAIAMCTRARMQINNEELEKIKNSIETKH